MEKGHRQFFIGLRTANRYERTNVSPKRLSVEEMIQGYNNLSREQDKYIKDLYKRVPELKEEVKEAEKKADEAEEKARKAEEKTRIVNVKELKEKARKAQEKAKEARRRLSNLQKKIKESEDTKTGNYKLFKYWLDPFNIALRNAIGEINLPRIKKEIIKRKSNKNVKLTMETVNKIRKQYGLEKDQSYEEELRHLLKRRQRKTSNDAEKDTRIEVTQDFADGKESMTYSSSEELVQIIDALIHKDLYEQKKELTMKKKPIEIIATYDFETGQGWIQKNQISKYKVIFEYDGKFCSKEIFGRIDLLKFYNDDIYRRLVMEAIEEMEMQNYRTGEKNNYIGGLVQYIKYGTVHLQQIFEIEDVIAINSIEKEEQKAQMESERTNQKLGR